jgi:hypothetical protein
MKNKQGNVAVIAIIIVIVAITSGAIGWLFAKITQAPTTQTAAIQSAIPDTPIAQTQPAGQSSTQTTQPVAQPIPTDKAATWQTYTNTQYSFTLQIPADWKGYTVKCQKEECDFTVPKLDEVFKIIIYTKAEWAKYQNSTGDQVNSSEEKLGENSKYVYAFGQPPLLAGGNLPDDNVLAAQLKEVDSIKKTFIITQ